MTFSYTTATTTKSTQWHNYIIIPSFDGYYRNIVVFLGSKYIFIRSFRVGYSNYEGMIKIKKNDNI